MAKNVQKHSRSPARADKQFQLRVVSSGFVIFRRRSNQPEPEFLVLKHRDGHWDFPKGHVEKGETHEDAAVREVWEETGLKNLGVYEFTHAISYNYKSFGKSVLKTVYYSIAEASFNSEVRVSKEHSGFAWLDYSALFAQLKFDEQKELLRCAYEFLMRH